MKTIFALGFVLALSTNVLAEENKVEEKFEEKEIREDTPKKETLSERYTFSKLKGKHVTVESYRPPPKKKASNHRYK